jgi:hypothetical protein
MSKRKTDEEVQNVLFSYGYYKIEKYINNNTPIKCLDKEGYIVYPTLQHLKDGKIPCRFHKSNPHTIHNIKKYIEFNNINVKLLSEQFINSHSKLLFVCACGELYETSWSNFMFKQKYCCNKCGQASPNKIPFDDVVKVLSNKNITLLFSEEEYNGICNTKLPIRNHLGYKALFSPEYYENLNKEPAWFHTSNPYTIENINLYLSANMDDEYICVSEKYLGNKKPLSILHTKCNHIFEAKWINLNRKESESDPNRHGTQCPHCTGLRYQSLHAVVLKQMFEKLRPGTVVEDPSCRNPLTGCILPTDIVNHTEKIAIEIQSWWHDRDEQKIKDKIKKEYWEQRGYTVYTPDIRQYKVIDMIRLFFPDCSEVPEWVNYDFYNKLNIDIAQSLLNCGLLVSEVAAQMDVSSHRIYDAIYNKRLFYPKNYPNKHLLKTRNYNQQITVQTAGV